VAAIIVAVAGLSLQGNAAALLLKAVLLLLFPLLLYAMRVYVPGEIRVVSGIVRGRGVRKDHASQSPDAE